MLSPSLSLCVCVRAPSLLLRDACACVNEADGLSRSHTSRTAVHVQGGPESALMFCTNSVLLRRLTRGEVREPPHVVNMELFASCHFDRTSPLARTAWHTGALAESAFGLCPLRNP